MEQIKRGLLTAAAIMALSACSQSNVQAPVETEAQDTVASNASVEGAPTAPLLEGIGPLQFPISTSNPLAQKYFNQAMTLAFGFNHAEAVRSFKEAARQDATCGICWAGAALALGPNINAPMSDAAVAPAWEAVQKALALRGNETPQEQAYIDAIATRYSEKGDDRKTLDLIYAGAIAGVVERYPEDLHARTLHAEALMDLMPWEYWKDDGSPASEHTTTLVEELEYVMANNPQHPGALHLYIHAMERFYPDKAVPAADMLGDLVPVAGHLVHMPSHIYLRVGRYADAVDANAKASEADEDYIAQCNAQGLYPAAYYPHNIHFLWYAAMMDGRKALAVDSALKLAERVPVDVARQMGALQSYIAVPVYTYIRFGMWDEILQLDQPAEGLPYATAMHLYGTALAHAALGNTEQAATAYDQLQALSKDEALTGMVMRRPQVVNDLLAIAKQLVTARLARDAGDSSGEIAALQQAIKHQDSLPYTEPPLWHYPVRQSLGDAQLRLQQPEQAQKTFAEDLQHFPNNPWSLYGMELALKAAGENADDVTEQRKAAWSRSDIEPTITW